MQGAFESDFRVGVAIGTATLLDAEQDALALMADQFNSATPENLLKWERVHPKRGRYDFAAADRFVDFGQRHSMFLVGHTLVWHSQTPDWVFQDRHGKPLDRAGLLERMRDHIATVVGRYRGRIAAWDVVNEALNNDGSLRDSPWRRIIGDDYLEHAFRFAAEADPAAKLYYNDYGMNLPAKRRGAVRMVERLKLAGCRVDGIGMQGHWGLDYPSEREIEDSIQAFAAAAGNVMITELDVNVLPRPKNIWGGTAEVSLTAANSKRLDPYTLGLPGGVSREQAERYAMYFRIFRKHRRVIDRVTFWGLDDGRHWHNNWPVRGRTAHSTLFDRSLRPKPAFDAVIETASSFD